jgi:hypothetical protein
MNLIQHMEAVFVATVALAVSGSFLIDNLPQAHAHSTAVASTAVPTVVVKAKRMTAAEKQQSLEAERDAVASQL